MHETNNKVEKKTKHKTNVWRKVSQKRILTTTNHHLPAKVSRASLCQLFRRHKGDRLRRSFGLKLEIPLQQNFLAWILIKVLLKNISFFENWHLWCPVLGAFWEIMALVIQVPIKFNRDFFHIYSFLVWKKNYYIHK